MISLSIVDASLVSYNLDGEEEDEDERGWILTWFILSST
jgi:hypothetical protein